MYRTSNHKTLLNYARIVLITLVLCVCSYLVHRRIQYEYHHRCSSDIVQILFFRNSSFCTVLKSVSSTIEDNYASILMNIMEIFLGA